MKKILGISVVALMAVAPMAANASIASKGYVDSQVGTVDTKITNHIADKENPHAVTKAQVGLGNVDNTSDADKPISTATQAALDLKANTANLGTAAAKDIEDFDAAGAAAEVRTALTGSANGTKVTSAATADGIVASNLFSATSGYTETDANKIITAGAAKALADQVSGNVEDVAAAVESKQDMLDSSNLKAATGDANAPFLATITADDGTVTYTTDGITSSDGGTTGSVIKNVTASGKTVTVTKGTIGTDDIADGAVTNAKLAGSIEQSKITGLTDALAAKQDKLTGTVGAAAQPVYMNNGTITASTATVGGVKQPVYMNNGTITAGTALEDLAYQGKNTGMVANNAQGTLATATKNGRYSLIMIKNGDNISYQWEFVDGEPVAE